VILLSEGFTIFNGPPSEVTSFFSQWGFKPPKYSNPADKLSNIASMPWSELKEGNPTIVEIAQTVRVKQLQYIEIPADEEDEILQDYVKTFTLVA
jgi:hypothetical protein